jgi:xanthine dehydrogenase accessory factor
MRWWSAGDPVGVATVVCTLRSAPRPPGAARVIGPDGTVAGSVSGGWVEGAVYDLARQVVASGAPVLQRYGVTDDDAVAVGLTCGGILDVYVERMDQRSFAELADVTASVAAGDAVAVVTCVAGAPDRLGRRLAVWTDRSSGSLGSRQLDEAVSDDVRGMLAAGSTGTAHYGQDGERRGDELTLFVNSFAPRPRMLVFGAIDFAAAVARVGSLLGFQVTVCDARPVFATQKRFPAADEVVVDWPHRYLRAQILAGKVDRRTVACVLTHDPKFDVPLLEVALREDLGYVGAMGSRRTHADRLERLRQAGLSEKELGRLRSPIGLDIGARTPEETAVSIAAEIVAARWGGSGQSLAARGGPIHQSALQSAVVVGDGTLVRT